jgi:putative acetyltransferase
MGESLELVVRPEEWGDYAAIAELHAEAFDYADGLGEVALVDALRRRHSHVPELSLVARSAGSVVGHAMFSLHSMRLGGRTVRASILAPVAVAPGFRGRGAASRLIVAGHRTLEAMGVDAGLVLGAPAFYSRLGYRPGAFGACRLQLAAEWGAAVAPAPPPLTERRVERRDVAELLRMWEQWYGDGDLSLIPGDSLADWISPDKRFRAAVLENDGRLLGYAKYREDRPHAPELVLAQGGEAMKAVLTHLSSVSRDRASASPLSLPLHPESRAVKAHLADLPYTPEVTAWDAGMMRVFGADQAAPGRSGSGDGAAEATGYLAEVVAGSRLPGLLVWPSAFDPVL